MSVRMRTARLFFAGLENVFATGAATRSLKSLANRSTKGRRKVHADSAAFRVETLDPRVLLTAVPVDDQFVVSAANAFEGASPDLAIAANNVLDGSANTIVSAGDFVAVWAGFEQPGGDTSGVGIYLQRYQADGTPKSDPVLVNADYTLGEQNHPTVAMDGQGNFVIAWESVDQDTSGYGIYAQRYDNLGNALGDAFAVNTVVTGNQRLPSVGMDADGNFVVAWQSFGQDGDGYGIFARRYDPSGTALDVSEFAVNTITAGDQQSPTVSRAATSNGSFVIAWQGPQAAVVEGEEVSVEIWARSYDAGATVLRGAAQELQINTTAERDQVDPAVSMNGSGNFVVSWTSGGGTSTGDDIFLRLIDAANPASDGTQLLVNDTTSQPQRSSDVAMDASGNVLATWQSSHQDGFSFGIYAKAYDSSMTPILPDFIAGPDTEFLVNTIVAGPQTNAVVTMNPSGRAIVGWLGLDDTHTSAVFGQRFQMTSGPADINVVGTELVLANFTGPDEASPSAANDQAGNFVVVWQSVEDVGDERGLGIYGQRFLKDGTKVGSAFLVNTVVVGNQSNPAVAMDSTGNFVVVWQGDSQDAVDADGHGIYAQRYDRDGNPQGSEFLVNSTTAGDQSKPAIAMDSAGNFVVVWQSPDVELTGLFARRFDANGDPLSDEFQVNTADGTYDRLAQFSPKIDMNAAGEFVVVWVSDHQAGLLPDDADSEKSVFAQWYSAEGTATGPEVLVHVINPEFEAQESPDVAIDAAGNFVVAWQSINQDGNSWGVFARTFDAAKTPLLAEFQVNQTTQGPQRFASVDSNSLGHFAITWQSNSTASGSGGTGGEGSSWDVYQRQYLADGTPLTDETIVVTFAQGPQTVPVITRNDSQYGIFWVGRGTDGTGGEIIEGVHGRLFEEPIDYGDAPDSYGTLVANNGAGHVATGPQLGAQRDTEADGQVPLNGLGDDLNGVDDEDGVTLPTHILARIGATITVNASAAGKLDAWIDMDRNGTFDEDEQIASSLDVTAGANTLTIPVSADAVAGQTFARFRISTAGGVGPDGLASDGEVEDYSLAISAVPHGGAEVVDDPLNPGQKMLLVMGTNDADRIRLTPVDNDTMVRVVVNGERSTFAANSFQRVVIFGLDGDDHIRLNRRLGVSAWADGGAGGDVLRGGSGPTILTGGSGNDRLIGARNRTVMIGGNGEDVVKGSISESSDLLVGAATQFDANDAALQSILAKWTSENDYATRVASLRTGPVAFDDTTVIPDSDVDELFGRDGRDWFLIGSEDNVNDQEEGEEVDVFDGIAPLI